MTENEIREIVRDEIAIWYSELIASETAADDQRLAKWREERQEQQAKLAEDPNDGPVVRRLKRILRGEEA